MLYDMDEPGAHQGDEAGISDFAPNVADARLVNHVEVIRQATRLLPCYMF